MSLTVLGGTPGPMVLVLGSAASVYGDAGQFFAGFPVGCTGGPMSRGGVGLVHGVSSRLADARWEALTLANSVGQRPASHGVGRLGAVRWALRCRLPGPACMLMSSGHLHTWMANVLRRREIGPSGAHVLRTRGVMHFSQLLALRMRVYQLCLHVDAWLSRSTSTPA